MERLLVGEQVEVDKRRVDGRTINESSVHLNTLCLHWEVAMYQSNEKWDDF
jgi:hypothetical protein